MLASLRVRDLAVLADVEVALGEGLTVFTGETGAGKSLLVDALALLSGERADSTLVRSGAEKLVVEGAFESDAPSARDALTAAGLLEEGTGPFEVVIRRELTASGKGRLFVNGSPAAVKTLQEIAPALLVLHGQAEARELLDPSAPRELVDAFGGLEALGERVAIAHGAFREAESERRRIEAAASERAQRLGILEHQIHEIDLVKPVAGEEAALLAEKAVLSNVEKVGRLLAEAQTALEGEDGGALASLGAARRALASLAELDPSAAALEAPLAEALERVSDAAVEVSRRLDRLEADPARLAQVAERLDALAKLKRKHGGSLEEVLAHRERIGREHAELEDLAGASRRAVERERAALAALRSACLELSARREAAAPALSRAVERHLRDLAFLSASLRVEVSRRADPESPLEVDGERLAFTASGMDVVRLAFAPNPGEPPRPLAKIASGGELSRVQLAVAVALAEAATKAEGARRRRSGRTLVFDEVDAGVSGATAEAVGEKLRALSGRDQVLVVTHLPQVAARGHVHHSVSKEAAGGRTSARVTRLSEDGRVESLAGMLAGASVGDAARETARQLLETTAGPRHSAGALRPPHPLETGASARRSSPPRRQPT